MKYVKRTPTVDAVQAIDVIRAEAQGWADMPEWVKDAYAENLFVDTEDYVLVGTVHGDRFAEKDDWIVKDGESLSVVSNYDFTAQYEAASS